MFHKLNKIVQEDGFLNLTTLMTEQLSLECCSLQNSYETQKSFLNNVITEIDYIATLIKKDSDLLISVKDQKTLRTCFQMITTFGISYCLIPGIGINITKKCASASILPQNSFSDDEKYELLKQSTEFLCRSYSVPVLKSIIITFHLSDYLAALIQLSFAPLKKPGQYKSYTMTKERYNQLIKDKKQFELIYEDLVQNCFQPILMKELLVLQSVTNPQPPRFVQRIISKEMSRRLISTGGILSLIRCFVENYNNDTAFEWKKVDMICKIISHKHGTCSETEYLNNMCAQIRQLLTLNNSQYLSTGVACALSLKKCYENAEPVHRLIEDIFSPFSVESLLKNELPGTVAFVPHEIEHIINILDSFLQILKIDWPNELLMQNFGILLKICLVTKKEEIITKIINIFIKSLEAMNEEKVQETLCTLLFGDSRVTESHIQIEETNSGTIIRYAIDSNTVFPKNEALSLFIKVFNNVNEKPTVENIFSASLNLFIEFTQKRQEKCNKDLLSVEDDPTIIDDLDQQYAILLQLLTEISTSIKVLNILKSNPSIVINFIDKMLVNDSSNEECISISLVLLSTLLSSTEQKNIDEKYQALVPVLIRILNTSTSYNHMLCSEVLSQITKGNKVHSNTPCSKALNDIFDGLLPIRAHGIIELTKLIDKKDPETLSKKQLIFCLFQEQLKDTDSYIYLSAINGLSSLATHCTEDVLHVLCKEFLQTSLDNAEMETYSEQKIGELRMKTGDIIVKVVRRLGEMAVVYKSLLLNTMLCGCRDDDPLIRTSALSNLAEIVQVLNYRIGTIIYEILLCIWGIIESDKAVECRRAAVMVVNSLLKGLGKDTLIELKDNLLPIYKSLKQIYHNKDEDSIVRLHAQLAIEELNQVVKEFLFPDIEIKKNIFLIE